MEGRADVKNNHDEIKVFSKKDEKKRKSDNSGAETASNTAKKMKAESIDSDDDDLSIEMEIYNPSEAIDRIIADFNDPKARKFLERELAPDYQKTLEILVAMLAEGEIHPSCTEKIYKYYERQFYAVRARNTYEHVRKLIGLDLDTAGKDTERKDED